MASLRTQTPEDNSRIQQLKVPMRKLRLAHRPFVLTIPDEAGTHFKVSVGRAKNRTVTGLAWKDGSFFRANFDLPPWAKDAAPPKDSNRIYVFKHGGGKSMGTGETEESGGSFTGVRIRIQDLTEFLAVFEKMVEELVTISRGKRGEVKAANDAEEDEEKNGGEEAEAEAAMKREDAGFPIVGVPLNENIVYEDAYPEEIDYNGSGPGEYLAVRTSGSKEKAVVELFGPIPTRDRRGRELKIESLHLREGWQPIVKVNAQNRQEALSQAAQYFSNNGFEAQRTYGTLHVHSPGVLSEGDCLGKTEALVEAKSDKGITLFGKTLDLISHGFYQITAADAKKACGGKLPAPGNNEKLCVIDDQGYFVARTPHNGEQVWSIRKTKWKPAAGGMKLGEAKITSMQSPDLDYEGKLVSFYMKGGKGPKVPGHIADKGDKILQGFHKRAKEKAVDMTWLELWQAILRAKRRDLKLPDETRVNDDMARLKALIKVAEKMENPTEDITNALAAAKKFLSSGVVSESREINEAKEAPRKISVIAREIKKYWPKPYYAAKPYLDAMMDINTTDDMVLNETGKDIVTRFLGNASTWRGPDAKRIKDELKAMVGWNKR